MSGQLTQHLVKLIFQMSNCVFHTARNRGLRAPWVQNLAAAYARSASFGRSGQHRMPSSASEKQLTTAFGLVLNKVLNAEESSFNFVKK